MIFIEGGSFSQRVLGRLQALLIDSGNMSIGGPPFPREAA